MKNRLATVGLSVTLLSSFAASAFAQVITMNQPDNGFFEGPSPEWATLHSTNTQGTVEHREYHRDGATALLLWLAQNKAERGTASYEDARRIFYQERNMAHRQFHTDPVTLDSLMQLDESAGAQMVFSERTRAMTFPLPVITVAVQVPVLSMYAGKPSRRTIIAMADEQNRVRALQH
jgi:hypothetical protein